MLGVSGKVWGPSGVHSGKVSEQGGFYKNPTLWTVRRGQERGMLSVCARPRGEGDPGDQAPLEGHEGKRHDPKWLDSPPGKSRPAYRLSS